MGIYSGGHSSSSGGIGTSSLIYKFTVTGSVKASIDTGVDAAQAGSGDWTNGDVLEILISARTDQAVVGSLIDCTVNNDGAANYGRQGASVTGAGAPANNNAPGETSWRLACLGDSGTANFNSAINITIPTYAGTTFFKNGNALLNRADSTAANMAWIAYGLYYASTSAITRFKMIPETGGVNFKIGTQLLIYKRTSV